MTKLITCHVCGETKPVRDDARVCSSNCRVKQWRKDNAKSLENKESDGKGVLTGEDLHMHRK